MSNLRQYGIAGTMYLDDNNDNFPNRYSWLYNIWSFNNNHPRLHRWHDDGVYPDGELWPYLEDKDFHLCQTFYYHAKQLTCTSRSDLGFEIQYSYTVNSWLGYLSVRSNSGDHDPVAPKGLEVKRPASVFWFSEENPWTIPGVTAGTLNDNNLLITTGFPPGPPLCDGFATYHKTKGNDRNSGKGNMVFVDGHVGSFHMGINTLLEAWDLAWPK